MKSGSGKACRYINAHFSGSSLKKNLCPAEITAFDYKEGLSFYEQFRPGLIDPKHNRRIHAAGADIVANSGLLYFLGKFKRKENTSDRSFTVNPSPEPRARQDIPCPEAAELIYVLAGMMCSAGELNGLSEHKNYS
jgi:hypothetical protein